MKLVSRVSSEVIAIKGSARLTDFRIESLKERFQQLTHLALRLIEKVSINLKNEKISTINSSRFN